MSAPVTIEWIDGGWDDLMRSNEMLEHVKSVASGIAKQCDSEARAAAHGPIKSPLYYSGGRIGRKMAVAHVSTSAHEFNGGQLATKLEKKYGFLKSKCDK